MSADPDAVIAGVARALRPGGRFVGEFGGHGNVAAIIVALQAALARRGIDGAALIPWYFPTPDEYRRRLERHGFDVGRIDLIPRPTPLPTGMAAWLEPSPIRSCGQYPTPSGQGCATRQSSCCGTCCAIVAAGGQPTMFVCASRQFCNSRGKSLARNNCSLSDVLSVIGLLFTARVDHITVPRP